MGELTFIAVVIVAILVAWGGVEWHLKCREVDRLWKELDGWHGREWDAMCAAMKATVTGEYEGATLRDQMTDTMTTTGSTSDDDE